MIDESQIEYLLNGERAEADVLNRPLRQLVSATNTSLGEVNDAISTSTDNTALLIEERYDDAFEVLKDGSGFTREKDAQLIFDAENATVSIAPGLGKSTWFYYHRGRKIESSETLTHTLSEAEKTNGGFYLSFNSDGDLVNTGPYPDFYNTTLCFYVHYSNGEFIIEGDERHGADRDTAWHLSHHREDGMVVYTLGSMDWTPDDADEVGIQITSTLVADEDLQHLIKHSPTGEEPFSQILEGSKDTVRIPTLYYDGSIRYLADKKLPWVVGELKFNDDTTLNDVPDGKFVNYFLVATHCQKYPIKLIMGRKIFDSDHETVDETLESLGLNFPEIAMMYRISLERDNSLSTVGKCKLKSVQQAASKITFESAAGSAGSGLYNHAQLLGRTDDNAHPISAITGLHEALEQVTRLTQPWNTRAIGEEIWLDDSNPAVAVPPTNNPLFRYIKLTAGENSIGGYNEDVLINENVSGSAPLIEATAEVNLPTSSFHGQTVRLLNTERRFVRSGDAGVVQGGSVDTNNRPIYVRTTQWGQGGTHVGGGFLTVSSADANLTISAGIETRPRNIGRTAYMRII